MFSTTSSASSMSSATTSSTRSGNWCGRGTSLTNARPASRRDAALAAAAPRGRGKAAGATGGCSARGDCRGFPVRGTVVADELRSRFGSLADSPADGRHRAVRSALWRAGAARHQPRTRRRRLLGASTHSSARWRKPAGCDAAISSPAWAALSSPRAGGDESRREAAVEPDIDNVIVLAASDPANAYGSILKWPATQVENVQPQRGGGARVFLLDRRSDRISRPRRPSLAHVLARRPGR